MDAAKRGRLRAGMSVVEASSGNASVAIASAAARLGCGMVALVPPGMSPEKLSRQRSYGVEAREMVAEDGSSDAGYRRSAARQLAEQEPDRYHTLDQFANPANPDGHERTTGAEILRQLRSLRPPLRHVDYFIAGAGTGGTITGVARALRGDRSIGRQARVVMADPVGSVLAGAITGKPAKPGGIEAPDGIGAGFWPANLDRSMIDDAESVPRAEALREVARLRQAEGIFAGPCTGYCLAALRRLAEREPASGRGACTALIIVTDRGESYLSDPAVRAAVA